MVAVTADADLATVKSRNTDDLVTGSGEVASMTLRAAVTASARTWCTKGANGAGSDGVNRGDGAEPAPDGPGVDVADLLPGVLGSIVLDSAAVVGLVLLPGEWRGAVLEPVVLADGLPAPFAEGERWVAFVVREDLVDGAMCDSLDSCVVFDGPLEVRSDEVRGPGLAAEPVLLLDEEGPVEPSEPVLSAWAMPVPLARAAPTPRVIAPAPSQPWATRCSGLARCRPFARRELPPVAVFARCPPATPAPPNLMPPVGISAFQQKSKVPTGTSLNTRRGDRCG
jgi:hypothetical protein